MNELLVAFVSVVLLLICALIYRGTLQIHEEDHIYIEGTAMRTMANEQSTIVARIEKVSRVIRALCVVSAVLLVAIAGLWIRDALKSL